ncbi:hypothetical protein AKJ40_01195 [candidate division MSBL1 archaeon SCGC-AAA259M10]|uniref:NADH-quinone oxidoreductase subunit J n=2 Tax=candidate division MSBL1 TaxID=215777 RepID=A0A133U6L6_9EURY|nr:hypothetical protein AKJ61_02035 [candidate division MSBL1 archaeon SCGC-AAA259B11]KXB00519.1 hypothetical protein AKJ40_01195 [candidate division MSBL1 archaeon SCGC-AAA259M10]
MIDIIVFTVLAVLAIVFSSLVVFHRSLVYGAVALGFLGMVNSSFFIILGFPFVGLFHLMVYIGATVVFILFTVTMLRSGPIIGISAKKAAVIVSLLAAVSIAFAFTPYSEGFTSTAYFSLQSFSQLFVEKYWFPIIVTALALATTLIEGITLARMEVE